MICWGWNQGGKRNHILFPATGMKVKPGARDQISGAVGGWCLSSILLLPEERWPLGEHGCLLEFKYGIQWWVGGGKLGGDGLWCQQEMWTGKRKAYIWCFAATLGKTLHGWSWKNREAWKRLLILIIKYLLIMFHFYQILWDLPHSPSHPTVVVDFILFLPFCDPPPSS